VFDIVVVLTGEEEACPRWPPCSDACDVGKECPSPFWEDVQGQTKWVLVTVVVTTSQSFQSVSVCPWHNPTAPAMTVVQNSPFIPKMPKLRSTETNGRRRDVTKSEWTVLAGPSSNTANTRQESEESILRRYEVRSEKDAIRALLNLDQKQWGIQPLDGRQTIPQLSHIDASKRPNAVSTSIWSSLPKTLHSWLKSRPSSLREVQIAGQMWLVAVPGNQTRMKRGIEALSAAITWSPLLPIFPKLRTDLVKGFEKLEARSLSAMSLVATVFLEPQS
jgi:hypothetical protein